MKPDESRHVTTACEPPALGRRVLLVQLRTLALASALVGSEALALTGYRAMMMRSPGPVAGDSKASLWTGATQAFSFSGSNVTGGGSFNAIRSTFSLAGDFTLTFTVPVAGGDHAHGAYHWGGMLGVYDEALDAQFVPTGSSAVFGYTFATGGMHSMARSWYVALPHAGGDNYGQYFSNRSETFFGPNPSTGSNLMAIKRVGGVFEYWVHGVKRGTWTTPFTGPVRICLTSMDGQTSNDLHWVFRE